MTPSSLRTRLRAVDEDRAGLQTRLIAALNRRVVNGLTTAARTASERDRRAATAWIGFRAGDRSIHVAPLLVENALAPVSGADGRPDAAAAAAALGRIEPLVAALELALGRELHPSGLAAELDGQPVLLRLDAGPPGGPLRHRLLVAVPDDLATESLAFPPIAPGVLSGLRLRWIARLPGPGVAASRLKRLGRGDLLVLGTGPLIGRLSLPGRNGRPRARIDLQQGLLILQQDIEPEETVAAAPEDQPPDPGAEWGELRVATAVELAGATVTAAELATLGRGSVLPLPANNGALEVRVLAGGEPIARGELVAVGQGFGVLITAVSGDSAD